MESFIKKVFSGKSDEHCHRQFVRFSRGVFPGRAALSLVKNEKIKLGGSFEYASDFVILASELGGGKVSGIVLSKGDISGIMSKNNIKGNSETKRDGLFYQNNIDEQEMDGKKLGELANNSYTSLLDVEGKEFSLKMKKKLPKPGKSGALKIDDKFCILEADMKFWHQIRDSFMLPECRKCKLSHVIEVRDIIMDKSEKDFAKMRENAKKKGKIIRKIAVDGREETRECEFVA
jgi:hypothetical protein